MPKKDNEMTDRHPLIAATVRGALVLSLVLSLGAWAHAGSGARDAKAERRPVAKTVRATTDGAATLITIAGTAPMAYAIRRADAHLLVVELPGVDASQLAPSYQVSSPLVSGVTVKLAVKENNVAVAGVQFKVDGTNVGRSSPLPARHR